MEQAFNPRHTISSEDDTMREACYQDETGLNTFDTVLGGIASRVPSNNDELCANSRKYISHKDLYR